MCLKYLYGGGKANKKSVVEYFSNIYRTVVAAIDMDEETRSRQPFKFCAELYRSADFFMLNPLLPVISTYLGFVPFVFSYVLPPTMS